MIRVFLLTLFLVCSVAVAPVRAEDTCTPKTPCKKDCFAFLLGQSVPNARGIMQASGYPYWQIIPPWAMKYKFAPRLNLIYDTGTLIIYGLECG